MDSTSYDIAKLPSLPDTSSVAQQPNRGGGACEKPLSTAKDAFHLKCVVVGDPLVGKSSLIHAFVTDELIAEQMLPGVLEVQKTQVLFEEQCYTLEFHDTDYNREARIATYAGADVIVLCYSIADVNSLRNIDAKWISEVKQYAPGRPYILVGCKSDMRELAMKITMDIVGEFEGVHVSAAIDSQSFLECSARTLTNIRRLSEELPAAVERHRELNKQNLAVAKQAPTFAYLNNAYFAVVARPAAAVQKLIPSMQQTYHNLTECFTNPGVFAKEKKTIVSYVPMLKNWLPYEEHEEQDVKTAKQENEDGTN